MHYTKKSSSFLQFLGATPFQGAGVYFSSNTEANVTEHLYNMLKIRPQRDPVFAFQPTKSNKVNLTWKKPLGFPGSKENHLGKSVKPGFTVKSVV